jgi:hypothetical protein
MSDTTKKIKLRTGNFGKESLKEEITVKNEKIG